MAETPSYIDLFDRNILQLFRDALRVAWRDASLVSFLMRVMRHQGAARRTRQQWETRGVRVPPFLIASITKRCDLRCNGCYAQAQYREGAELDVERLRSVIAEADALGISFILVAGGEPLTRPEILDIAAEHPNVIFPLFTNGLLLDQALVARLRGLRNVTPILSVEGHATQTDARRGAGVHGHALEAMARLGEAGVFYGASLTVTMQNLDVVTDDTFVADLVARGCRVLFYVDYVPVQPGTDVLALGEAERLLEAERLAALRQRHNALFIAFPGDEEQYGGCLSAGRGFVHISAEGRVEPCPFAPYSDASVTEQSLVEALRSDLLRTIRENADQLSETRGGCALWEKREWVSALAHAAVAEPV